MLRVDGWIGPTRAWDVKKEKPLKVTSGVKLESVPSCLECGKRLYGAAAVVASVDKRTRKVMPKPGDINICWFCGHIMAFDENLQMRPLTEREAILVAGDRRILAIQKGRADYERVKALSGGHPGGDPGHGAPGSEEALPPGADRIGKDEGGG